MTPDPKSKTFKSKKYRDFIAAHPCVVSGIKSNVHHEPLGLTGMGMKCPDSHCVPLKPELHTTGPGARHQMGADQFWESHDIDVKKIIIGYISEYLELQNIDAKMLIIRLLTKYLSDVH
jgi:hypothetical protein